MDEMNNMNETVVENETSVEAVPEENVQMIEDEETSCFNPKIVIGLALVGGAAIVGGIKHNVDKGIPLHSLLDSASRHLAKYMVGMDDEDHLRAACWNLLWALNQRVTHPELDDRFVVKEKKKADDKKPPKMFMVKCTSCGKEWPMSEDDWLHMSVRSFTSKNNSVLDRCPNCNDLARIYKVGEVSTDE